MGSEMCIRDRHPQVELTLFGKVVARHELLGQRACDLCAQLGDEGLFCLLYTSDAADEEDSVDLG